MRRKSGVSLIALVATIVVMGILASVIVMSIDNNNPIAHAEEAALKGNLAKVVQQAEKAMSEEVMQKKGEISREEINKTAAEMNVYIQAMPADLKGLVIIENGDVKLTADYRKKGVDAVKWATELKIEIKM